MAEVEQKKVLYMPKREEEELEDRIGKVLSQIDSPEHLFHKRNPSDRPKKSHERSPSSSEQRNGTAPPVAFLSPEDIAFSPYQTREISDEHVLDELVRSVESKGIIQPIVVRPLETEDDTGPRYELVAGERRLRAAKLAGLEELPALIQHLSDLESVELSIIENAQREDLNPIEEALAYQQLVEKFKLNHTEISKAVGKNRATVSNALRLLQLCPEVVELLRSGELSAGHGRALLAVSDEKLQIRLAQRILKNFLSVRATEALIARLKGADEDEVEELSEEEERRNALLERHAEKICETLGVDGIGLRYDSEGVRRLNISFSTEASWKRFMSRMRS